MLVEKVHGISKNEYKKILTFRNYIQQVLFEVELMGQISDGEWEGKKPFNHWEYWNNAEVNYDESGETIGRNFYVPVDNYNFNKSDLLDVVGDRMIQAANLASRGFPVDVIRELHDVEFDLPIECDVRVKVSFDGSQSLDQLICMAQTQFNKAVEPQIKGNLFIKRYFTMVEHFGNIERFHALRDVGFDMKGLKKELKDMKSIIKTVKQPNHETAAV